MSNGNLIKQIEPRDALRSEMVAEMERAYEATKRQIVGLIERWEEGMHDQEFCERMLVAIFDRLRMAGLSEDEIGEILERTHHRGVVEAWVGLLEP